MIEREATVKISSELLANLLGGAQGRATAGWCGSPTTASTR